MRKLFLAIFVLSLVSFANADVVYVACAICNNTNQGAKMQKVIFLRKSSYTNGALDSTEMLAIFEKKEGSKESSWALLAEMKIVGAHEGFIVSFIKSPFDDVYFPISSGSTEVKILYENYECSVSRDFK